MNNRYDMTDWIIHFVHKRNEVNDPLEFSYDWENTLDYIPFPDSFKYDGTPIFQTNKYEEDEYGLEPDAEAFSVLKKILYDGIIRTGWSFRKNKPTIYGPKSAACFTEMPIYSLIEYSKERNDKKFIAPYGIAFLKEDVFEMGARPVIYGLTETHREAVEGDSNFGIGLRTLSFECGIGIKEMYRYVYTNITKQRRIDWTHEREWRWADISEKYDFPGMPFFVKNGYFRFSKLIVIVKNKKEVSEILDYIQHLYHSGSTNYGREYDLTTISNTYVVSIEDLSTIQEDIRTIKLDDLPLQQIPKLQKIIVRKETIERVKMAIEIATEISHKESEKIFKEKGDVGGAGFAHVVTYVSNSEITQSLIDLGVAKSYGTGMYYIYLNTPFIAQSLDVREAGEIKAAEYLTKELGQLFSTHWEWD